MTRSRNSSEYRSGIREGGLTMTDTHAPRTIRRELSALLAWFPGSRRLSWIQVLVVPALLAYGHHLVFTRVLTERWEPEGLPEHLFDSDNLLAVMRAAAMPVVWMLYIGSFALLARAYRSHARNTARCDRPLRRLLDLCNSAWLWIRRRSMRARHPCGDSLRIRVRRLHASDSHRRVWGACRRARMPRTRGSLRAPPRPRPGGGCPFLRASPAHVLLDRDLRPRRIGPPEDVHLVRTTRGSHRLDARRATPGCPFCRPAALSTNHLRDDRLRIRHPRGSTRAV